MPVDRKPGEFGSAFAEFLQNSGCSELTPEACLDSRKLDFWGLDTPPRIRPIRGLPGIGNQDGQPGIGNQGLATWDWQPGISNLGLATRDGQPGSDNLGLATENQ